jgi:hypothetical protein
MMNRGKFLVLATGLLVALGAGHAAARQAGAIRPFNGQNLNGWSFKQPTERSKWTVGQARLDSQNAAALVVTPAAGLPELVNAQGGGVDIYTDRKFSDVLIELEVMVPKGANSGIYVHGEYEIQVLDSYGKAEVGPGDMGGLYGAAPPRVNASKAPGEWQNFVIAFRAPRFEGERKVENARFVRIVLNGQTIHENVEMQGPTPSGVTGKESPMGSLMFQGDHGPVAYRNITVTPQQFQ